MVTDDDSSGMLAQEHLGTGTVTVLTPADHQPKQMLLIRPGAHLGWRGISCTRSPRFWLTRAWRMGAELLLLVRSRNASTEYACRTTAPPEDGGMRVGTLLVRRLCRYESDRPPSTPSRLFVLRAIAGSILP
jgi:hypothetical protein